MLYCASKMVPTGRRFTGNAEGVLEATWNNKSQKIDLVLKETFRKRRLKKKNQEICAGFKSIS